MSTETRVRATMAGFATLAALLALLAVGAGGCGGGSDTPPPTGDDADAGPPTITSGPYQPLTVGSTWTYHVDDQGVVYDKQSTVEALEDMGGAMAGTMGYKVRETVKAADPAHLVRADRRPTSAAITISSPTTPAAMLSDEWYSPYLLRVDEAPDTCRRARPGRSTTSTPRPPAASRPRRPTRPRPGPSTASTSSPRVPAGTFNALKVTRTDTADGSTKTQWFVARRRQGQRAHRRRPLRRADQLHHRPRSYPVPSPRAAGRRVRRACSLSGPLVPQAGERVRERRFGRRRRCSRP